MSDWIESSQKAGNFIFAIASGFGKADILKAQGHLNEALQTCLQSLQLASNYEKESQRIIAHHYLGMAMLYHETGDAESSAQYYQKGLMLGEQSMLIDWPYRKFMAMAQLKESDGDLEAALNLLNEARRLYVKTPIPNTRPVDAFKARVYLKQGRLDLARDWAHEHGLSVDDDLAYLHEFEHITLARVLMADYQSTKNERAILDALALLQKLLKKAEDAKRPGSVIEILVVQSLAYQVQGSLPQALAALERALTIAQPEGFVRIFMDEGAPMNTLLTALENRSQKQNALSSYIHKLLSAFANAAVTKPEAQKLPGVSNQASPLIEPLSQRELEVLQLIAQGLSNAEISQRLFLAMSTVKGHNLRIFNKLQAKSRTEAVALARELGLL
jgi:LuxR family maltose regulon positive regulatory protein